MKKKECHQPEGFDDPPMRVIFPARDYSKLSLRQLKRESRRMHLRLQAIWCAELKLPEPDWEILASVSRQLKTLEEACPEVCEP